MKNRFGLILLCSFLLSACATTGGNNDQQKRFAAIASKYPESVIVVVEGAGTFISTKIMIASIKSGVSSTTSDAILKLLSNRSSKLVVAVTGEDDSLTSATLERAILDGKGKISGSKAVFVGSLEYKEQLSKIASESGVQLEFITYP
jgi:hypothetical protein